MDSNIQEAARLLIAARKAKTPADAVDTAGLGCAPNTLDDAYRIQQAVVSEFGDVGAWKTSAPSAEAVPIRAPIFAADVYPNQAEVPDGTFRLIGIEAEIAFRLGCDLPARDTAYSPSDIIASVDAMLPVLEIVDSRLSDFTAAGAFWKLADNQVNGGLVIGAPVTDWQNIDPQLQPVVLKIDGEIAAEAIGGNPAGSLVDLIARLANDCGDHCGGLQAGQIITTGSMTGIIFVSPGARIVAEFDGLGDVGVTMMASA
mgnify:CR=1 FL=1